MAQLSRAERRRRAREGGTAPGRIVQAPPARPKPAAPQPTRGKRARRPAGAWWLLGALALVIILAGAWWAFSARSNAPAGATVGARVPYEGNTHVAMGSEIKYRAHPPASGNHYDRPAPPGVYPGGILPGFWVHSLEHGYVVLVYKPPVPPEMLQQFDAMVRDFPKSKYGYAKLVIVPYSEMDHRFAVLAWTWRLWLDAFDRQKVLEFYRAHVDRGPEDIP